MLKSITDWINANPVIFGTVLWPLLSALVLAIFKPRTPEEYAKMNPRVAGFLVFISGLGFDPSKALVGLKRLLTGSSVSVSTAAARDLLEVAKAEPPAGTPPANDSQGK